MERIEKVVDEVMKAFETHEVGLWMANFHDIPDDFGQWGGVVRVSAESHLRDWKPSREALLERVLSENGITADAPDFGKVANALLPIARDDFAKDLEAKQVPARLVEKAKGVLLGEPPVQQWRM